MVDFPEGYGFGPGYKAKLMQEHFSVDIGVFEWVGPTFGKRRSPYAFTPFGKVVRNDGQQLYGYMLSIQAPPVTFTGTLFTGTLQEICTAMCTVHRMTGGKT